MKVDLKAIYNKQKVAQKLAETKQTDSSIARQKKNIKIHKLSFNEENIGNPNKAFDIFESKVTKIITKKEKIDPGSFFAELNSICKKFVANNQLDRINKNNLKFAEKLVALGDGRLAAIIYSLLIKLNSNNIELVEHFATNGLIIAKRFHDPVHIMARCEDLRRIYNVTCPQSEKMLKVLYEEKKALNSITKNYTNAQNKFQTLSRDMKPLENYQIMQGAIQIQIAKMLKNTNPKESIKELESANALLSNLGKGKYTKEIQKLLNEIKLNNK